MATAAGIATVPASVLGFDVGGMRNFASFDCSSACVEHVSCPLVGYHIAPTSERPKERCPIKIVVASSNKTIDRK